MTSEVDRWVKAFRDPKRRAAWLKKSKRLRAESKVAQARTQAALDSDDPDKALDELYQTILAEQKEQTQ